jgi:hypothetical protein
MRSLRKLALAGALAGATAAGAVAGATMLGSATAQTTTTTTPAASSSTAPSSSGTPGGAPAGQAPGRGAGSGQGSGAPSGVPSGPHQANGKTETVLTGDDLAKVTAAVQAKEPGATIIRAETDADGGVYEAHITKADGSVATIKFDASFNVTSEVAGMA